MVVAETAPLLGASALGARGGSGAQGWWLPERPLRGVWTPLCLPAPLLDRELFPSCQAPCAVLTRWTATRSKWRRDRLLSLGF